MDLQQTFSPLQASVIKSRLRASILQIAFDEFNLAGGSVLLASGRERASEFCAAMLRAEECGLISEDQAADLCLADVIIRARRADDRRWVHPAFEVSCIIGISDIKRARDRAAILEAATGWETIAAVVGAVIDL